jgi:hypothetical protein
MVHRAGRVALERKLISAILYAEPSLCPDCMTVKFRIYCNPESGGHVIELIHKRTCPCKRSAWSRRAASDHIRAVLLLAGLHLAEYNDTECTHK